MANKYRGEVGLTVDGRSYTLRIGMAELAEMEAALGVEGIGPLALKLKQGSATVLMKMARVALAKNHPGLDEAAILDLADAIGAIALTQALDECIAIAIRGPVAPAVQTGESPPNA